MSLKAEFEEKYGASYTLKKCKQNNCALKDISSKKYFIINGDTIKERDEKSVDCIIIDLKSNDDGKYKIILCELTTGSKDINDAISRFKSSGKLIINRLNGIDKSVYNINCLVLGNITKNGKSIDRKKLALTKFKIEGLNKKLMVNSKGCGFSITEFES